MSENTNTPLHRITFAERMTDQAGQSTLGEPRQVAAVWRRKQSGKQGGTLSWKDLPQQDGVYFFIPNQNQPYQSQQSEKGKTLPTHSIRFAQSRLMANGEERLDKPEEVGVVWPRKGNKQGGIVEWSQPPHTLGQGAYFVLDRQRTRQTKERKDFERPSENGTAKRGLER